MNVRETFIWSHIFLVQYYTTVLRCLDSSWRKFYSKHFLSVISLYFLPSFRWKIHENGQKVIPRWKLKTFEICKPIFQQSRYCGAWHQGKKRRIFMVLISFFFLGPFNLILMKISFLTFSRLETFSRPFIPNLKTKFDLFDCTCYHLQVHIRELDRRLSPLQPLE